MADAVLDQMVARARLQDLVADYAGSMDWIDWDLLDRVFWPEAQFDFGMFKGDYAAYRNFARMLEEPYSRRLHMFGIPMIRIEGDRARVDAGSLITCRTDDPAPGIDDTFWGRYVFEAEQRGGEWRFSRLTYLLNLAERVERKVDDRAGPMNFSEGLSPRHPFAGR
ncbi:nuclear transport factor 2 family protein [Novosphingobium sp. KCTC 2891]|uniref:nuclear transport factor 2 family protein n=1 Tax=Novosphingobium sp. KCTC 2891 TaxID=2989730 RepID=UPI002221B6A4|nr:nuclear transport factor 2 family protein [Novosphingobium sp. KCTC 2891]MCW1383911.1 nuclear transport factor 2 family protein [Novosphingobium sp. KCTC 2891]